MRDLWIGRSFRLPSALSKIEARLKNTCPIKAWPTASIH